MWHFCSGSLYVQRQESLWEWALSQTCSIKRYITGHAQFKVIVQEGKGQAHSWACLALSDGVHVEKVEIADRSTFWACLVCVMKMVDTLKTC
jgi:hypothetical protein